MITHQLISDIHRKIEALDQDSIDGERKSFEVEKMISNYTGSIPSHDRAKKEKDAFFDSYLPRSINICSSAMAIGRQCQELQNRCADENYREGFEFERSELLRKLLIKAQSVYQMTYSVIQTYEWLDKDRYNRNIREIDDLCSPSEFFSEVCSRG